MIPKKRLAYFISCVFSITSILLILQQHFTEPYQDLDLSEPPSKSIAGTNDTTHPTTTSPRILLVSAMFPLSKSKHSDSDYLAWLSRFLGQITTEIYIYTPPSTPQSNLAENIRSIRPPHFPIHVNTSYASPFHIPPLHGLEDTYREMHSKDREGFRHSPELYAVWNAKPFLLHAAVQTLAEQGQEYDYAFWVDAGSFRGEHAYSAWPDPGRVEKIWEEGARKAGMPSRDLILFPMAGMPGREKKYWVEDMGPIDYDFSEGSFFGGTPHAISWWADTYYQYHSYYLSLGHFVGKDQTLINAIFLLFPERIITVWYNDPLAPAHLAGEVLPSLIGGGGSLGRCGSEWYYYEFFLADQKTRDAMRSIWMRGVRWSQWWDVKKVECRLTDVLSMGDILRRRFGKQWKPPRRSLMFT